MRLLGLTFLLAPAVLASAHRHPSGSLHRRQSNYRNFGGLEHVRDHFLDVDVNIDLGLGEDADNGAIIDIDLGIGSGSDHPHFDPNHWLGTKVWKETTSWTGSDFESWDFETGNDPTHGAVDYVGLETAKEHGLVGVTEKGQYTQSVSLGPNTTEGFRESVRISSPRPWRQGELLIGDFEHIPEGCGTWPAFWGLSKNFNQDWPKGGEIDIVEGVNSVPGNQYTLHTLQECYFTPSRFATDKPLDTETCFSNTGCSVMDRDPDSFGPGLNKHGGGMYAAYYDEAGIRIWFWPRNRIPLSIRAGRPIMLDFGRPKAYFKSTRCSTDEFFDKEMTIIINTTIMGDWAGSTFTQDGCPGTFEEIVADENNFKGAYWVVNSVKIFQ